MTPQGPLTGQIVFATPAGGGITLDCILGDDGLVGEPMTFTVKRIELSKLGITVLTLLERWARDGSTVAVRFREVRSGTRVVISASGTRVVLEPEVLPA
jgi:hypothetical protein